MKGGDKMSMEYVNIVFAFAVVMLILSLVITIAVQIIVTVFGIRGRNLIWGVTKVLERSPTLKNKASEIADAALHHAAVTPNKRTATAIGSKELLAVLQDLADAENESLDEEIKKKLEDILNEAIPQESREYAEILAREFKALFPTEAEKMNQVMNLVKDKTKKLKTNFETWFDTVMNRTTDRFVIHTRIWTIIFAILLAGGLQIDSLDLIKTLSTDVELRAVLIKSADRTLERADEILLSKSIPVEALESVRDKFEELKAKEIPNTLATRNEGVAWLTSELSESGKLAEIKEAYLKEFDRLTPQRLEKLGNHMLEIKDQIEVSRLVFLPGSWSAYVSTWKEIWGHIPGIILSALLLSLGAPFWFNALRSIATMRTILAGKADPSKSAER
jgi:hypothetical protein